MNEPTSSLDDEAFTAKWLEAGKVFTPGSPVNERDLFAGRIAQLSKILEAVSQRGYHAVLFGERGVGKTSLTNVLIAQFGNGQIVAKVVCDASDTFSSIWRKAFKEVVMNNLSLNAGFIQTPRTVSTPLADSLPDKVQPDDVRRMLAMLASNGPTIVILDEFDRVADRQVAILVSDTIKALSDFGIDATILIVGVADSIDELIEGHASIERALVQIPMPRMSSSEISQIFDKGIFRLEMEIDTDARNHLINLAQGLPYIAHLLGLYSVRSALESESSTVERLHADAGISVALDQWQQSIRGSYYSSVKSPQPGNIYKEVLLACAMAETDELGYFTAASVRTPLRHITGRNLDIPNFARHLKEFSQVNRGEIITRVGAARRLRYRFVSPIMRPYIIIRGYAEKLIQ